MVLEGNTGLGVSQRLVVVLEVAHGVLVPVLAENLRYARSDGQFLALVNVVGGGAGTQLTLSFQHAASADGSPRSWRREYKRSSLGTPYAPDGPPVTEFDVRWDAARQKLLDALAADTLCEAGSLEGSGAFELLE